MVERSLRMREARGSIPRTSIFLLHFFLTSSSLSSSSSKYIYTQTVPSSHEASIKHMTLSLFSPPFPPFSFPYYRFPDNYYFSKNLTFSYYCSSKTSSNFKVKASLSEAEGEKKLLDDGLISLVSSVKDAGEVLDVIAQNTGRSGGVVSGSDCCLIIAAALERSNAELAISVFDAMRSTFHPGTFAFSYVVSDTISFEIAHLLWS